ncbi:hypothetical protein PS925_04638 [Pseudomonas fluorescens]|uniref:DUF3077 domain-containing protein n=1 Tax=Pseudomonas fluorescens TaxID=294 RepID=A0A5E7V6D1_PSEFL|nr:DUF6124 family protein [Pseudomonas fluorescens]VVQ19572.1 hypothetical protein PS925_04638 [Pseudomonas fluorescens]
MFKAAPNPPDTDPIPYDAALEPQNIKEATERAINFYLNPSALKTSKPTRKTGKIYLIDPTVDDETLLVEAYESLSSASDMATPYTPNAMFQVNPQTDTESLLANACESLASASVMLCDFAGMLEGPHRQTLLGIAQVVMLGELAVNQALEHVAGVPSP